MPNEEMMNSEINRWIESMIDVTMQNHSYRIDGGCETSPFMPNQAFAYYDNRDLLFNIESGIESHMQLMLGHLSIRGITND